MYQLMFYLLYKGSHNLLPENPGKNSFLSAFFLTILVQINNLYALQSILFYILHIDINEIYERFIFYSTTFLLFIINYFLLFKRRRKIINNFYWKYGKQNKFQILAFVSMLSSVIISLIIICYFRNQ